MYAPGNSIVTHRISGSFHWQLKLNSIGYSEEKFAPTDRKVFMDTGTTLVLMPYDDWISLYEMICNNLPSGSECYSTSQYYVLKGYEANKEQFGPIKVQIDDTYYMIPFERFFSRYTDNTMVLRINTKDHIVFGIQFLNSFYQVFDVRRNQMGLVPNAYTEMPSGLVISRDRKTVVLPSTFAIIIAMLYLAWHQRQEKRQMQQQASRMPFKSPGQSGRFLKEALRSFDSN